MERIENLKDYSKWSYKQHKKQRNTSTHPKSHWDYLLDEMVRSFWFALMLDEHCTQKWMRTDFREERKWKMAIAYNLSTAVLEWHAARTPEIRIAKGICVLWKRPREETSLDIEEDPAINGQEIPEDMDVDAEVAQGSGPQSLLLGDYGSDDDDDEDPEKPTILDPLDSSNAVDNVVQELETVKASEESQAVVMHDIEPKTEEVDDSSVLKAPGNDDVVLDIPVNEIKVEEGVTNALKDSSKDPNLGGDTLPVIDKSNSQSTNGDAEASNALQKTKSTKATLYAPIREHIAHSAPDKLFIDADDYRLPAKTETSETKPSAGLLPPPDITSIFSDMQAFTFIEPPSHRPSLSVNAEGKKRSDKRAERDDLHKRIEETSQTKIYPATKFMYIKPTLLGPLNPANRWKDGKWLSMEDDIPVSVEPDAHVKLPEESSNG
jgi:chromatin modification-related protein VID21